MRCASILSGIALLLFLGSQAAAGANPSVRARLTSQGFSGSLADGASIDPVGRIVVGQHRYDVYYVLHISPAGAHHATQTIVVLEGNRRYLGRYLVDERPGKIMGRDVIFAVPKGRGDRLHFDEHGPPTVGVLDGYPISFSK